MELRPELLPPKLDQALMLRLSELADRLDGPSDEQDEADLVEFNQLAGTSLSADEFQGIYEAMSHKDWVRCLLWSEQIEPVPDVTRDELIEVIRRAKPEGGYFDEHEAYMMIFDTNVVRESASALLFYPPGYDHRTQTWGEGRPIAEYDPTPEQIVDWAMEPDPRFLVSPDGVAERDASIKPTWSW